jgi:hypothetical protein
MQGPQWAECYQKLLLLQIWAPLRYRVASLSLELMASLCAEPKVLKVRWSRSSSFWLSGPITSDFLLK